ncbi:hypothetical protein STXM2123_2483 [Streptomyces sp. F-3]|nr:hypothetical protein STXM2123_2483 [Streptomyces sp. F-3]
MAFPGATAAFRGGTAFRTGGLRAEVFCAGGFCEAAFREEVFRGEVFGVPVFCGSVFSVAASAAVFPVEAAFFTGASFASCAALVPSSASCSPKAEFRCTTTRAVPPTRALTGDLDTRPA